VAATAPAEVTNGIRDWWLRTVLVLSHPRAVFVALRDESSDSLSDRAEPILLIVWLAGIALVLDSAGHYFDTIGNDNVALAIWVFLAGGIYGGFGYFAFGALVYWAARSLGSQGTYRRARQVVAFAAAPLVLSLVFWPFRIAIFGDALFESGGRDTGAGAAAFGVLEAAVGLWAVALLVVGIRAVHGWTWARASAAAALALGLPVLLAIAFAVG
jgi:hypothetical protein